MHERRLGTMHKKNLIHFLLADAAGFLRSSSGDCKHEKFRKEREEMMAPLEQFFWLCTGKAGEKASMAASS
eukprot:13176411-Ditylum_brightwellii.AAC.1